MSAAVKRCFPRCGGLQSRLGVEVSGAGRGSRRRTGEAVPWGCPHGLWGGVAARFAKTGAMARPRASKENVRRKDGEV